MSDEEQVDVVLPSPVTINGEKVTDFILTRQPTGKDLGRHSITELLEGDTRALATVTPKLIQPHLSKQVILNLSGANLLALTSGYAAFLEGVDFDSMAKVRETSTSTTTKPASTPNTSSGQKAE